LTVGIPAPSVDHAGTSGPAPGPVAIRREIAMASTLVLDRIAAWERSGVIDHDLAERLRAVEVAEPAATVEATPAPVAAIASSARVRSSGFIIEFFAYLGGLFLLLAWYAWFANEMPESESARNRGIAVAAFIPAVLLAAVGWLLAARDDAHLRRAAAIAFAVAIPNAGVGTWALLRATALADDGDSAAIAAGAGVALALAIVARVRRPSAITQAALLASWGVFALELARWVEDGLWGTGYDHYREVVVRSPDEQLRWNVVRLGWWWLIAAVPAIVMIRRPDHGPGHEARDVVARIGIGTIAVLGSATAALAEYDWSSSRGGEPIFGPWLAAGIMLGVAGVFLAAARASGSRIHLVTAGAAIVVGLTYLNVKLVVEAVGAPMALLVEGLILLGVAALGWALGRVIAPRTPTPSDGG
jgi:hypothetical protein